MAGPVMGDPGRSLGETSARSGESVVKSGRERFMDAQRVNLDGFAAPDASLGLALSRLGNHVEAVPHLEKALELDDDGSLYYQLGRAYQAMGQREKAVVSGVPRLRRHRGQTRADGRQSR